MLCGQTHERESGREAHARFGLPAPARPCFVSQAYQLGFYIATGNGTTARRCERRHVTVIVAFLFSAFTCVHACVGSGMEAGCYHTHGGGSPVQRSQVCRPEEAPCVR